MVRLVFRPYTQFIRSICTSEPLRASTRVSSGFTLFRHSSPSFGSQQICSYSDLSKNIQTGRCCSLRIAPASLSLRIWVCHPNTRIYVRLLGPCFKTGRLKPFRQRPKGRRGYIDREAADNARLHAVALRCRPTRIAALALPCSPRSAAPCWRGPITLPKQLPGPRPSTAPQTDVDLPLPNTPAKAG